MPCIDRPEARWHGHGAVRLVTILLLRCNPACFRDAKLIKTPLHNEAYTLLVLAMEALPLAKHCNCVCARSCSSSSVRPMAAFDPAQHQDAAELGPSGTSSHPIKFLCAVISVSVVSWSSGRVFSQKLISGSKTLWMHEAFRFYSNNLVNTFASSSTEKWREFQIFDRAVPFWC